MQFPNTSKTEYPSNYPRTTQAQPTTTGGNSILGDPIALVLLCLEKWWVFVLTLLLSTGLGLTYLYFAAPEYRAKTRIEIIRDSRVVTRQLSDYDRIESSINRHVLLLQSKKLHYLVKSQLQEKWGDLLTEEQQIIKLEHQLIRESRGTMVDLMIDSTNPDYGQDYLNLLLEKYQELRLEETSEVNSYALSGLKLEEERVLEELDQAKLDLQKFEAENRVSLAQQREQADSKMLGQLVSKLKNLKMEKSLVESQFEGLLGKDAATIREALLLTRETMSLQTDSLSSDSNTSTQAITGQWMNADSNTSVSRDETDTQSIIEWERQLESLASLEEEFEQSLKVFKPSHPKMVEMKSSIDILRNSLEDKAEISIKRFQAYYDALVMQEAGLEKAISEWENEQSISVQLVNRYNQLNSQVQFLERKYQNVYARILENSSGNDLFFVRIIEPTSTSYPKSVKPDPIKIMIVAVVGGLALGAGFVVLFVLMKPKTLDFDEIEQEYHIPYFTGIPQWDLVIPKKHFDPSRDKLVVSQDRNKTATETYRAIRSKINIQYKEKNSWVMTVTSTRKGDGKTFNCANLAQLFSWDSVKVALLDADFRKGSLTRHLIGENPEKGLAEWFINQECDLEQLAIKKEDYGFDLYPAGVFQDTLPELVNERSARRLYKTLKEKYDVIIVDTAPATMVVETPTLCQASDGTMIIAAEKTPKNDFRYLIRELHNVRIIGFCINHLSPPKKSVMSNYSGYGGKYHHYGYGETYQDKATYGANI